MFGSNPGNKDGGNLVVEPGQQVTVELVPDYGYQLDSVSLNGNTLAPQDKKSTFTFTMPQTNVHFKGAFVKAADVTDVSSAAVGKIEISNGDNAAASGNLKIDVSDSASDTTKANEQIAATDGVKKEIVANLDISLQNIVSKGTNMQEISADNYWVNDITEFEKPIRLDVAIKDFDKDSEYSVVREHNGSYDVLDATVSDGKISFETNKFSTYVIVKKTAVKAVVTNPDTVAKPQGDKKPADIKTTDKTVDKTADNAGNETKLQNIKNEKAAKTDDNLNVALMLGMLLIGAIAVSFSFRKKSL